MKNMLEVAKETQNPGQGTQPVTEARRKQVEPSEEKVVQGGKVVDKDDAMKAGEKSNAAKKVKWAVDEPTDDDATKYADKSDWNTNMLMLRSRLRANKPFFILGHAGWGKTQIIKSIAKKFGRTIITVYLDKALPEDLNGIPVPMEGEKGSVYQETALPAWAAYMIDHPEKKFLLFFDEMNQADPRVMNALMPIVQENTIAGVQIPNYIVGAAGNYKDENTATSKLSEPLMERFAPIIQWEDKTPEAWKDSMRYLHKQWDSKVGKELVDEFEKNAQLFRSPRVVDQKLLDFLYELKQLGEDEWDMYDGSFYLKYMKGEGILEDDLSRSEEQDVEKLADYIDSWMRDGAEGGAKPNNRSREILDAPDWLKEDIEHGMKLGWILGDVGGKYVCSRENICELFIDEGVEGDVNAEQVWQEVKKNEKKGIKFKYETVKDALKDNPNLLIEDKYDQKYGVK